MHKPRTSPPSDRQPTAGGSDMRTQRARCHAREKTFGRSRPDANRLGALACPYAKHNRCHNGPLSRKRSEILRHETTCRISKNQSGAVPHPHAPPHPPSCAVSRQHARQIRTARCIGPWQKRADPSHIACVEASSRTRPEEMAPPSIRRTEPPLEQCLRISDARASYPEREWRNCRSTSAPKWRIR